MVLKKDEGGELSNQGGEGLGQGGIKLLERVCVGKGAMAP